jgi:hypothetical protein
LICSQIIASVQRIEKEPLLSHYPMYSGTYPSTAAFDASSRMLFTRIVRVHSDRGPATEAFATLRDDDRQTLLQLAEKLEERGSEVTPAGQSRLAPVCERYGTEEAGVPEWLAFVIERGGFDWSVGDFRPYTPVITAPVRLADLCEAQN